jgi:translation initiation factor IF-2
VILVVAANDGVMPQTREAIAHAKAARVPILVALNKIDRPDANPDFVKRQLAELGLVPDEWGGNTLVVPVSAKQKIGLVDLLEAILLTADSNDIRANPNGKLFGTVIEAQVDKSKGVVATLLVQNGTLEQGDIIVAGTAYGRLRALFDHRGRKLRKAGPSTPVQVLGLSEVPEVGEIFTSCQSEREARAAVEERRQKAHARPAVETKVSLEELFSRVQSGEQKELNLIIKADVQGSLEPITSEIRQLDSGDIKINILYAEAGNVTENDVMQASASKAIIIGFNVSADTSARRLADAEGVPEAAQLELSVSRLFQVDDAADHGLFFGRHALRRQHTGHPLAQGVAQQAKVLAVALRGGGRFAGAGVQRVDQRRAVVFVQARPGQGLSGPAKAL